MNLFQLILKNMRQRALSTWLTLASVALGTALGVALIVLQRGGGALFGQTEFGYNLVVGAKGSPLQLVLNNVYFLDQPPGAVDWEVYCDLVDGELSSGVQWAVPLAWGDTHEGRRIIGTTPQLFEIEPRADRLITFTAGGPFEAARWQAVVGSDAAEATGLGLGDTFQALHGDERTGHEHAEAWTVVGVLAPTGTALDKAVYVPVETEIALGEHGAGIRDQQGVRRTTEELRQLYEARRAELAQVVEQGGERHEGYVEAPDGTVLPETPPELWRISGILVRTTGTFAASSLLFRINNADRATAAVPAEQMRMFFDTFLQGPSLLLLGVTALVTVVAAVGILVSIYNSVSARRREIAILRSLGATRNRVLAIVTLEATLVGAIGALLGFVGGHLLAAGGSELLRRQLGEGIDAWVVSPYELAYLGGVIVLAFVAGLIPALKAYGTPVAQNLSE